MRRICSRIIDLVASVKKLTGWFKEEDYPEDIVNKETRGHLKIFHCVVLKHLKEVHWAMVELSYPYWLSTIPFLII